MSASGMLVTKDPLTTLEDKLHLVRDRVTCVAKGFATGLYLHGRGGGGKSFAVIQQLDALETSYALFNSRMTGKGLFQALKANPDAVLLLEDMERLVKDRDAQGVLRSALFAQPGHERIVSWTTATEGDVRFAFRGGIILTANCPLANLPELYAINTRIIVLPLDVTDAETEARMRELATSGYTRDKKRLLEGGQCEEIVDHLVRESRAGGCALNMRLLDGCYQDFLAWHADLTALDWRVLVSSRVRQAAIEFIGEANTEDVETRRRARRNAIRDILKQTGDAKEQLELYKKATGAFRADYYKRKKEVESGEFDGE